MSIIGPRPQTQRCFDAFLAKDKVEIMQVLPGLSGIGSIIFRNEEELLDDEQISENFYDEVIMPFKGRVESWYVRNQSLHLYLTLIFITVLFIFKPRVRLIFSLFKSLPKPPPNIMGPLALNIDKSIYKQVAELHVTMIPDGFLSSLGVKFLSLLYEAIDKSERNFLDMALNEDGYVIGFVAGGSSYSEVYFYFIRNLIGLFAHSNLTCFF